MSGTGAVHPLAALDHERPDEPMTVRVDGTVLTMVSPVDVPAVGLVKALSDWRLFLLALVVEQDRLAHAAMTLRQAQQMMVVYRLRFGLCGSVDDDQRLCALLGRPARRDAVEADLREVYQLDLTTEWQARRWRRLLNCMNRLRGNSHLHEVLAQDDELAAFLLAQERKGKPAPAAKPRLSEFSTEAGLLSVVADRLAELIQVVHVSKGGKYRKVQPLPRPESALARARRRQASVHHNYTVARARGWVDEHGRLTDTAPPGLVVTRPF